MAPFVQRGRWSAERFMGEAERVTGSSNWGEGSFRLGLEALLASLREVDDITPLGTAVFGNMIKQALVNRLRFIEAESPSVPLIPPLIITGLPRSGTTALHRMLALDPEHYAPPLWELLDPFADSSAVVRRWRTRLQIAFKNRLLPELDRKHFTRADTPEECTLLLANSLASPLFWDLAPLDRYLRWYRSAPMAPVYGEYRRQLEVLQQRHAGRRLVLKAPAHLGNLAALREAVPESVLIQTHRDPTRCFFSHCSLRESLSRFVLSRVDASAIADHVLRVFDHDLHESLIFHRNAGHRVFHVSERELRSSAVQTVRSMYSRLGLEWTAAVAGRVEAYDQAFPRDRFGRHRPRRTGWGVDPQQVDGLFEEYRTMFSSELAP